MSHLPSLKLVSSAPTPPVAPSPQLEPSVLPPTTHLVAFLAVADHLSIKEAAQALGKAQSTIGRTLKAFECHIGARLVERTRPKLTLTPVGKEVLSYVRAHVAPLAAGLARIRAAQPKLRVWVADRGLAAVIEAVWRRYRQCDPRPIEFTKSEAAADICLGPEPEGGCDSETTFLAADEWVAVAGRGWTQGHDLSIDDLHLMPLIFERSEDALAWQWFLDTNALPVGEVMMRRARERAIALGQGIMLVNASHHARDLQRGRLIPVSAARRWTGDGLWVSLKDRTPRWDHGWSFLEHLRSWFDGDVGGAQSIGTS